MDVWISLLPFLCLLRATEAVPAPHVGREGMSDTLSSNIVKFDLKMRGAKPLDDDAYLCTAYEMPKEEHYIVQFEAMADVSTVHHILIFGCDGEAAHNTNVWRCPRICGSRSGREQIMFAWAKNAPPTKLPKNVGFRVGGRTTIKTLVLQIHYAHKFQASSPQDHSGIQLSLTQERQKYVAGIYLLMSYRVMIPPNTPKIHADISCKYEDKPEMHPFAYRTHAHSLGVVITGYQYNNSWHQIGKGNPQWPQAFYPVNKSVTVSEGDKLVARCTYNSTGRNRTTRIGATGADEMCNFYIMYYTDSYVQSTYRQCGGNNERELVKQIPADSDVPLPPNPALEETAKGHHHHHHHGDSTVELAHSTTSTSTAISSVTKLPKKLETPLKFDNSWHTEHLSLGQIGGVATDKDGNVYIFHRSYRVWDVQSFDLYEKFLQQESPIENDTVVILDKNGRLIRKFGSHEYFMPHGIEVDNKGNIWLTDVALHQVFRIPAGSTKPDLILGTRFEPGEDEFHFCKPADVAVLSTGEFYVADGYCNGRILKFSADGSLIKEWGQKDVVVSENGQSPPGAFDVPHSVTVAEDKGLVCVADRENGRIQCFDLEGTFRHQIKEDVFGPRLFALEYCPLHDGILFAINGPTMDRQKVTVQGFTLDIITGRLLQTWTIPQGLKTPHDIAVDPGHHAVYVGELNPKRVWKLSMLPNSSPANSSPDAIMKTPNGDDNMENVIDIAADEKELTEKSDANVSSDFTPSIIIGVLLIIPVVLLLVITLFIRLYHNGKLTCFNSKKSSRVFSLQGFLNSHKGFDRVSTEESDHELDPLDDSDQEEYSAPKKGKV